MTYTAVIDESGDTGTDTRFFTMAAIISMRPRNLLKASKTIPHCESEYKFHKAPVNEIERILETINDSQAHIIYVSVDKYNYAGKFYGIHGPKLYRGVLSELLGLIFKELSGHDVNVLVDDNSFISRHDLDVIAI